VSVAEADAELIYVADVMCSWCWGFAPTVERLRDELALPVTVINGGLRPGDSAESMTPKMADFLRGCWTQVGEASGQPFDFAGLERPSSWRYDTEPAARLVATVRELAPAAALPVFHRLQEAFYAENVDVVDPSTWEALLTGLVDDPAGVAAAAMEDVGQARAWRDFSQARAWGITGFPCLLLRLGDQLTLVTRGWAPADPVVDGVRAYLDEQGVALPEGAVCAPGGAC